MGVVIAYQWGPDAIWTPETPAPVALPKEYDMTRSSLLLIPLIALAACSTPRERCIAGANRPVATLDRLITTTRGNIERGFALRNAQATAQQCVAVHPE